MLVFENIKDKLIFPLPLLPGATEPSQVQEMAAAPILQMSCPTELWPTHGAPSKDIKNCKVLVESVQVCNNKGFMCYIQIKTKLN